MKRVWILAIGIATLVAGVYTLSAQQVGWPPPPGTQAFLCVYNASPPSLSTGVAAFVQCDSSGNVRTTGGGGGGGAVTLVDGADVTQGAEADSACATDNGTCTVVALLKRIAQRITTLIGSTLNVVVTNANSNGQATMDNSSPVTLPLNQQVADPCMFQAKTNLPISQNGTSSVQLIALSGSTSIYVCSLSIIAAGTTTVAFTTGTGSACVTGNAAVIGSTTANIANSMSFAANGGLTLGNGQGTIAKGAASSELCMINGSNVYVSGNLTYVQQ